MLFPRNNSISPSHFSAALLKKFYTLYKLLISPMIHLICGPSFGCRFIPTCSEFAGEALHAHGYIKGGYLTLLRILRCHPFSRAGYDPVPHDMGKDVIKNLKTIKSDLGR